jgi:dienelactone hydrolase
MDLQPISYEYEGTTLTGYVADGSGGAPSPGILVAHEGGGLARHTKERARRLGELGYVAFALDMYGEENVTLERAMELGKALRTDIARIRGLLAAALDVLTAQPNVDPERLAAIGYCMGGAAAVELARAGAPLTCIVGFHSGILDSPAEDDKKIAGKVLLCHGADDPIVPPTRIHAFTEALTAAAVDWQLHLYGGVGHSFTNRDIDALGFAGFAYDSTADARSWRAMLGLFDEVMERRLDRQG